MAISPLNPQPVHASPPLMRRYGAMVYEGVLLFGVSFIAGYLFDTLTQSRNALMYRHARESWLFLVFGIYFVYFWTHSGQTLAMKTWHIRLVSREGTRVSIVTAIARYCACWVFVLAAAAAGWLFGLSPPVQVAMLAAGLFLPPLLMLVLPSQQFLYDHLLGTRLVQVTEPNQPSVAASKGA